MRKMGNKRLWALALSAVVLFGCLPGCQKRTTVNLAELETAQIAEETGKTETTPETTEAPTVPETVEASVPESEQTAPEEPSASETESADAAQEAPETQAVEAEPAAVQAETSEYVLNTNSGKIHRPDCKSVQKMKESNKKRYTGTLADLEAQGYVPCKVCKP